MITGFAWVLVPALVIMHKRRLPAACDSGFLHDHEVLSTIMIMRRWFATRRPKEPNPHDHRGGQAVDLAGWPDHGPAHDRHRFLVARAAKNRCRSRNVEDRCLVRIAVRITAVSLPRVVPAMADQDRECLTG